MLVNLMLKTKRDIKLILSQPMVELVLPKQLLVNKRDEQLKEEYYDDEKYSHKT